MAALHLSKEELLHRVGRMEQVAGVKQYTLHEGKKDGMRGVDIWNGSGMALTILPQRGSDIANFSFKGMSLCWLSQLGLSSPEFAKTGAFDWNKNFSGGMLTTCGLTTAGLPSVDNGEELTLHGNISNLQSEEVCCETEWIGDDYYIHFRSKTYQSVPFQEHLCLSRSISVKAGENIVTIRDKVENLWTKPVPFMMIYHMNFGYPLLDEGSELYLTYDERYPTSPWAKEREAEIGVISAPADDYVPCAYNHSVFGDEDGFAYAALINPGLQLGATIRFHGKELNQFNLWKCLQKSNYVVGLEPSNCRTWGRDKERKNGNLILLDPFEVREMDVQLQIHQGEKEIKDAIARYPDKL